MRNVVFSLTCVVGAGLFPVSNIMAQSSGSSADEEEIFELSPFEVDGSQDSGYRANSTLAGSRLSTQLKDVAASVSVLTNEFMDDLGASNIEETLSFVAGAETGQDFVSDTTAGWVGGSPESQPSRNRVRGLSSADVTADFFTTANEHIDRYNIERVSVVRGPNSILFGLGSPSGIINYATKKANFGNARGEAKIILDDFGSQRFEIDYNSVIVEDKLAVRFMSMYDDERYQYNAAFDRDKRTTVALRYKPSKRTSLDVSHETLSINSRRPRYVTPEDRISAWAAAGSPTIDPRDTPGTTPGILFQPVTDLADTAIFFTDLDTPIRDLDPNDPEDASGIYAIRLKNRNTDSSGAAQGQELIFYRTADPLDEVAFNTPPGVQDERVFPIFDLDMGALPGNWQSREGTMNKIVLNHAFSDDLNVEVGYMKDQLIQDRNSQIESRTSGINVDPNTHLLDGTPNPNFLRPFIAGRTTNRFSDTENETFRVQVGYELDLVQKTDRNWMGLHRFGGLYSKATQESFAYSYEPRVGALNHPAYTPREDGSNNNTLENSFRRTANIYYVGDAVAPGQSFPTYNGFPSVDLYDNDDQFFLRYVTRGEDEIDVWTGGLSADGSLSAISNDNGEAPLSFVNWINTGTHNMQEIESKALTMQSYFLGGKLVTTLGYRDDSIEGQSVNERGARNQSDGSVSFDRQFWGLDDSDIAVNGDSTMSKGVVVHPLDWLSLHFNESENFVVSAPATDINGRAVPGSSGEGTDLGFSVRLMEDKLNVKVNWFETTQKNNRNGSLSFVAVWRMPGFERELYRWANRRPDERPVYITPDGTDTIPGPNSSNADVNDFTAEGMEIEATYNPTRNWRISANVSKAETIQSNTGVALLEYIERRMPAWEPFLDLARNSSGQTFRERYNERVGRHLFPALSSDGRTSADQAKWSANLIANYTFRDGRMKGFAVGGSARWREARAIGYGTTTADGITVTNIDDPHFGPATENVGLHASFRKKIFDDSIDWRIQLNIRNVVGDADVIPIRSNPDGSNASFRVGRAREFQLTNSFKF